VERIVRYRAGRENVRAREIAVGQNQSKTEAQTTALQRLNMAQCVHIGRLFRYRKARRERVLRKMSSVHLIQFDASGHPVDCGWLAVLSANTFARLKIGDVVEIECHSRHASGKFREARLVRIRTDKAAAECCAG
jgi:hypothetical protein